MVHEKEKSRMNNILPATADTVKYYSISNESNDLHCPVFDGLDKGSESLYIYMMNQKIFNVCFR